MQTIIRFEVSKSKLAWLPHAAKSYSIAGTNEPSSIWSTSLWWEISTGHNLEGNCNHSPLRWLSLYQLSSMASMLDIIWLFLALVFWISISNLPSRQHWYNTCERKYPPLLSPWSLPPFCRCRWGSTRFASSSLRGTTSATLMALSTGLGISMRSLSSY